MDPKTNPSGRLGPTGKSVLLIGALLALHLNLNEIWLEHEQLRGGCDVVGHLERQLLVHDHLNAFFEDPTLGKLRALFGSEEVTPLNWPKLTYLVSSLGTWTTGRSNKATILFTSTAFNLVLCIALLLLGRALFDLRRGMLACTLLLLFPFTAAFSRSYGLDLPLAAMVTLSLAILVRVDSFRSRRYTLLLALACVLTIATKLQGPLFLAGPVGFVVVRSFFILQTPRKAALINLGLFVSLLAGGVALGWGIHAERILFIIGKHSGQSGAALTHGQSLFSAQNLLFYPMNLFFGASPLFFVAGMVGLLRPRASGLLITTTATALLIYTFVFTVQWGRYLVPLLPLLALGGADLLLSVKRRPLRRGLVIGTLVFGFAQLLVLSFIVNPYQPLMDHLRRHSFPTSLFFPNPPRPDNNLQELRRFARLLQRRHRPGAPIRVGVVEDLKIGRDPAPLLSYVPLIEQPGAKIVLCRSGTGPWTLFGKQHQLDYVVIVSRAPVINVRAELRNILLPYRQGLSYGHNWPTSLYDYGAQGRSMDRFVDQVAFWPVILRLRMRPQNYSMTVLKAAGI